MVLSSTEIVHDALVQNGENNATGLGGYRADSCHKMHTDIHQSTP